MISRHRLRALAAAALIAVPALACADTGVVTAWSGKGSDTGYVHSDQTGKTLRIMNIPGFPMKKGLHVRYSLFGGFGNVFLALVQGVVEDNPAANAAAAAKPKQAAPDLKTPPSK